MTPSRQKRAVAGERGRRSGAGNAPGSGDPARDAFRSGDALCAFDGDLRIRAWNRAAEELTGISEEEALSRPCWQVLGGLDAHGALVCHSGCSNARLAVQGRPIAAQELLIKTDTGRRWTTVSTVVARHGDEPLVLHLIRSHPRPAGDRPKPVETLRLSLTPRQQEVLELLAAGEQAKIVARRLGIAEATVRNHIRAILHKLESHSQIEAVARARRLGLLAP